MIREEEVEKERVLNKAWLNEISKDMLQDLVNAESIAEILLAFEKRLYKNKKWCIKKPSKADIILEKMDNDFEKWTNENTRKKMHKFANNYFTSNVINPLI